MPTDPFVNPDLDDRPRHHQNLPAGVALPPADRWTGGRPGDLPAGQPHGALLGEPGPNVGYAYTLVERNRERLQLAANEDPDDAAAVVAEVAAKRAAALGRAPVVGDVEVAMAILGYDSTPDDELASTRSRVVRGAAHEYPLRRRLVDAVPFDLLRRPRGELGPAVDDWRARLAEIARAGH
jgi:hypothetical protein